ncbi:MAG: type II toxin-antitoxin system VapC family toxin [Mesorhizobium sp.]|nr:type II toxin-antitoxin system VapC family toxin [Mesorhizobium sp.]MBN9241435.1 type II toxin-antitoxin system VapC family toxin [Mesorhizobium sp.]
MSERYLVDTNIVLWGWHEPHRLSQKQRSLLTTDAEFHVSVATIWEICIKAAIGKLETVPNVAEALIATGYLILPIKPEHAEAVRDLPLHHHDPFDRLLIAQAQLENLSVVTADGHFSNYDIKLA